MKKRAFIDKPNISDYGQYTFYDDSQTDYVDSNGLVEYYDKFAGKDLYTKSEGNQSNEIIIDNDLRLPGMSSMTIDNLEIINAGVKHDIYNVRTYIYIFDENWITGLKGVEWAVSELDYDSWITAMESGVGQVSGEENPSTLWARTGWYTDTSPLGEGGAPDHALGGSQFLTGLYSGGEVYTDWGLGLVRGGFNPNLVFNNDGTGGPPYTSGDNSDDDNLLRFDGTQTIYVAILTGGDAQRDFWGDSDRHNRVQMWKFKPYDDLVHPDDGGDTTQLTFTPDNEILSVEGGRGNDGGNASAAAFKVSEFLISINTKKESTDATVTFDEEYLALVNRVDLTPRRSIRDEYFNIDFLQTNPTNELALSTLPGGKNETDFIASTNINIKGYTEYDLQAYQINDDGRQFASAPNQISFNIDIKQKFVDTEYDLENLVYDGITNYKYYIISWDDGEENKFIDWNDVNKNTPVNEFQILQKQKEGLYIFKDIDIPIFHNYTTSGIKVIKAVVFSYRELTATKIIPIRWKLVTARLFLDMPINDYPDFAELGGGNYTTIPWPHTTPVIGGTDENSNYKISVRDTLGSGNIGHTDVLDERLLVGAYVNDELGQSIENFDLEQLRYFDTGQFNISKLLYLDGEYGNYVGVEDVVLNSSFETITDTPVPEDSADIWDASLHPNPVRPEEWSEGPNFGVNNPQIGHHAYFTDSETMKTLDPNFPGCLGNYCIIMRNQNSEINHVGRWLGVSQDIINNGAASRPNYEDLDIEVGSEIVISWWQMTSNTQTTGKVGILPKRTYDDGNTCDWYWGNGWSGISVGETSLFANITNSESYVWEQKIRTITVDEYWVLQPDTCGDGTNPRALFYLYGDSSSEGIIWFDNAKAEVTKSLTSYDFLSQDLLDVPVSNIGGNQADGNWSPGDWGTAGNVGPNWWSTTTPNFIVNRSMISTDGILADGWQQTYYDCSLSPHGQEDAIYEITTDGSNRQDIQRVYDVDGGDQRGKGIRIEKSDGIDYVDGNTYKVTFDARASSEFTGRLRSDSITGSTNIDDFIFKTEWQTYTIEFTANASYVSYDGLLSIYSPGWGICGCINYDSSLNQCYSTGPYLSSNDWFEIDNVYVYNANQPLNHLAIQEDIGSTWPITGDANSLGLTNVTTPWGSEGTKITPSADGVNSNNVFIYRDIGGDYDETAIPFDIEPGEKFTVELKYKVYGTDLMFYEEERTPYVHIYLGAVSSDGTYIELGGFYDTSPTLIANLEDGWKHVYYSLTVPSEIFDQKESNEEVTRFMFLIRDNNINLVQHPDGKDNNTGSSNSYAISNNIQWAIADVKLTRGNQSFSNSFSEKTLLEEIFINDIVDPQLKKHCKLELNCGNITNNVIDDTSGNSNKGLLIGDYKVKKKRKNQTMRRDSFIKVPKKDNRNGAL